MLPREQLFKTNRVMEEWRTPWKAGEESVRWKLTESTLPRLVWGRERWPNNEFGWSSVTLEPRGGHHSAAEISGYSAWTAPRQTPCGFFFFTISMRSTCSGIHRIAQTPMTKEAVNSRKSRRSERRKERLLWVDEQKPNGSPQMHLRALRLTTLSLFRSKSSSMWGCCQALVIHLSLRDIGHPFFFLYAVLCKKYNYLVHEYETKVEVCISNNLAPPGAYARNGRGPHKQTSPPTIPGISTTWFNISLVSTPYTDILCRNRAYSACLPFHRLELKFVLW